MFMLMLASLITTLGEWALVIVGWSVYENLSYLEVVYIIAALIGLFVHVWGIHQSIGDLNFLLANKINGMRKRTAKRNLRNHIGRVYVQIGFFLIGLFAAFAPPRRIPEGALSSLVASIVFITVSVVLAYLSVSDMRDRVLLINYQQAIRDAEHAAEHEHHGSTSKSTTMIVETPETTTTTTTITTSGPNPDSGKFPTVASEVH